MSTETYGDDFDPVEQFDEIDPADFAWHDDGVIVVVDGDAARELRTWEQYDDVHAYRVRTTLNSTVKDTLNNPIKRYRQSRLNTTGRDTPTTKLCNRLCTYLVTVEELDKPSF